MKQTKLLRKGVHLAVLGARGLGTLLDQALLKGAQGLDQLLPAASRGFSDFSAQFALKAFVAAGDLLLQLLQLLRVGLMGVITRLHQPKRQQQQEIQASHCQQRPSHPLCHQACTCTVLSGVSAWPRIR